MEQLQLTKQTHSAGWVKIFTQDVTTTKGSLVFVKQFTALSFSIISYVRSIFPEEAYTEKEFEDVKVKVLAGNYECKDAYLMTKWIKSAFDALDNNYMRELVLEILSPEGIPLEYYAVEYKYTTEGPTCSLSTNSKIMDFDLMKLENSTRKLINNLLTVTENLDPLPKKYKLQLRINYYDEETPRHYKPKFFSHAKSNDSQLEKLKKNSMGSLETPYHSISVYSGSALVALDESQQSFYIEPETTESNDIPEKQKPVEICEENGTMEVLNTNSNKVNIKETEKKQPEIEDLKNNDIWTWTMDKSASAETDSTLPMFDKNENIEEKLYCLCNLDHDKDNTFKCQHCESFHHLVCYRISSFGRTPEDGCCFACAKLDTNLKCTDVTLMKYKPRQAKHLAVYRQVLYRCHGMKSVSPKTLQSMSVPDELIEHILKKLLQENFIRCQNKSKQIYSVNKVKLAAFYKRYFST